MSNTNSPCDCDAAGTQEAPTAASPARIESQPTTIDSELPCPELLVRFNTIFVRKAERFESLGAGNPGEFGDEAEWELTLTVNEQSWTWKNNHVRDGVAYPINHDFIVDLVSRMATISIQTSGVEDDFISADDPLPSANTQHRIDTNWGIGRSHELSANSGDFDYSVNYTITCLPKKTESVTSRKEAINAVQARIKSQGATTRHGASELLTIFINKMTARGLQLKAVQDDLLFWEGPTSIQQMIPRVFPTEKPKKADKTMKVENKTKKR